MKNFYLLLVTLLLMSLSFVVKAQSTQAPFTKGMNLSKWFEKENLNEIHPEKYNEQDFLDMKSMGVDVIRLPINLMYFTDINDNTVDPKLYELLDPVVQMAENNELYIIIDNHTLFDNIETRYVDGTNAFDLSKYETALVSVWTQVATHYASSSEYVIFELQNEPNNPITTTQLGGIAQNVINAIRTVDAVHYVVVGGTRSYHYEELQNLPEFSDTKLIYTFHYYEPMVFTHQGAAWTILGPLQGVPYPYDPAVTITIPQELQGTWVEENLQTTYKNQTGQDSFHENVMSIVANFASQRNRPVFCGEFGVYNKFADAADRLYWTELIRTNLEINNIPWTVWEYKSGINKDGFGLFEPQSSESFDCNLDLDMLVALGLTQVAQSECSSEVINDLKFLYDDYVGHGMDLIIGNKGTISFTANDEDLSTSDNVISWADANNGFGTVGISFDKPIDISGLINEGKLNFLFKATTTGPTTRFWTRFTDGNGFTLENVIRPVDHVDWNGQWQVVALNLSAFWKSNPAFDTSGVVQFEFINKDPFIGAEVKFNDIKIWNGVTLDVPSILKEKEDISIVPNPITDVSYLRFKTINAGFVSIDIYSLSGTKIKTFTEEFRAAGEQRVNLKSLSGISRGLYLCKITTPEKYSKVIKFIVN